MEDSPPPPAPVEKKTRPNRVQVVVRVRPIVGIDNPEDIAVTVNAEGTHVHVAVPEHEAPGATKRKDKLDTGQNSTQGNGVKNLARSFEFDLCLSGNTTQEELFDMVAMTELVDAALDGYTVTIFAFGQTGSGKTHSMVGPRIGYGDVKVETVVGENEPEAYMAKQKEIIKNRGKKKVKPRAVDYSVVDMEDGLLPRCLAYAYQQIDSKADEVDFTVTASCAEIYNEVITDLMAPDKDKSLQLRQDKQDGFFVDGLASHKCENQSDALEYMATALKHRHIRGHKLNQYSSRSHCLMTFKIDSQEKHSLKAGARGTRRHGKLVLVDLAGSERLKDTGHIDNKEAVKETGSINKSLFILGQVLASLAARGAGAPVVVPYRDSNLTKMLWEGLRGTGRALMLACVGPLRSQVEETMSTLHFATTALRIKSEPVVLLDPLDQLVLEMKDTIKQLRQENKLMAQAMKMLSDGAELDDVMGMLPPDLIEESLKQADQILKPTAGDNGPRKLNFGLNGKPGTPDGKKGKKKDKETLPADEDVLDPIDEDTSPEPSSKSRPGSPGKKNTKKPSKKPGKDADIIVVEGPPVEKDTGRSKTPRKEPREPKEPKEKDKPNTKKKGSKDKGKGQPQDYPELDKMESEFQETLKRGSKPGTASVGQPSGEQLPRINTGDSVNRGVQIEFDLNGDKDNDLVGMAEADAAPDPKAVEWAQRNRWFGEDLEMTSYAYEVHDQLVGNEGIDPTTETYYKAIESRVSAKFPEKWLVYFPPVSRHNSAHIAKLITGTSRAKIVDSSVGGPPPPPGGQGPPAGYIPAGPSQSGSPWGDMQPGGAAGAAMPEDGSPDSKADYEKLRNEVYETLRRAKEEAEAERRQILATIGKTISTRRTLQASNSQASHMTTGSKAPAAKAR